MENIFLCPYRSYAKSSIFWRPRFIVNKAEQPPESQKTAEKSEIVFGEEEVEAIEASGKKAVEQKITKFTQMREKDRKQFKGPAISEDEALSHLVKGVETASSPIRYLQGKLKELFQTIPPYQTIEGTLKVGPGVQHQYETALTRLGNIDIPLEAKIHQVAKFAVTAQEMREKAISSLVDETLASIDKDARDTISENALKVVADITDEYLLSISDGAGINRVAGEISKFVKNEPAVVPNEFITRLKETAEGKLFLEQFKENLREERPFEAIYATGEEPREIKPEKTEKVEEKPQLTNERRIEITKRFLNEELKDKITQAQIETLVSAKMDKPEEYITAVRAFQTEVKTAADGIFGPLTYQAALEKGKIKAPEKKEEKPPEVAAGKPLEAPKKPELAAIIKPSKGKEAVLATYEAAADEYEAKTGQIVILHEDIGGYKEGTPVKIIDRQGGFVKVVTPKGKIVDNRFLTIKDEIDDTNAEDAKKFAQLEYGFNAKRQRLDDVSMWTREVVFNKEIQLANGQRIERGAQASLQEFKDRYKIYVGTAPNINYYEILKSDISTFDVEDVKYSSAENIARVKSGINIIARGRLSGVDRNVGKTIAEPVAVLGETNQEYLIRTKNGKEGWIAKTDLVADTLVAKEKNETPEQAIARVEAYNKQQETLAFKEGRKIIINAGEQSAEIGAGGKVITKDGKTIELPQGTPVAIISKKPQEGKLHPVLTLRLPTGKEVECTDYYLTNIEKSADKAVVYNIEADKQKGILAKLQEAGLVEKIKAA